MAKITLTTEAGKTIHIDQDSIVRITDGLPTDSGARTYVYGPDEEIIMTGDAAAFAARIAPSGPFAQLTRANGTRVWIKSAAISVVREPLPNEMSGPVRTTVLAAGAKVAVREDVNAVLAAIGWV